MNERSSVVPRRDYTDFFDAQRADAATRAQLRGDFVSALRREMRAIGLTNGSLGHLQERLWSVMDQPIRHYHSPVHVLAMFDYAAAAGMELTIPERLAIWFHDSVYDPTAPPGANEAQSASLMSRWLSDASLDPHALAQAQKIILSTAQHAAQDVPREHHRVLDLDLAGFSAPRDVFERQSAALRLEFAHVSDTEYAQATAEFLRTLLSRGSVYRSAEMAARESAARRQIEREIQRLTSEL